MKSRIGKKLTIRAILMIFVFAMIASNAHAKLKASFSAVPTSGTAPLEVVFKDKSKGKPTGWQWDFDNDGTVDSTDQDPTHIYPSAGVYSVRLTITSADGSNSKTKTRRDYITVNAPPYENLGNSQVFSNVTTSNNRRAAPYTMPEDGIIQGITMYHAAGNGQILLGVYADDGQGAPGSRLGVTAETAVSSVEGWQTVDLIAPVFVTAGTPIWLAWVYENNPGIRFQSGSPGRAQSNETLSGGMPISYGPSSFANYIYSIYATYIPFDAPPPVAEFSAVPTSGTALLEVAFTDESTGDPTDRQWDFDNDGTVDSTEQNPTHTYASAGVYSVKLTVTAAGGSDVVTKTDYITVDAPAPVAEFSAVPTSGTALLEVAFTDESTGDPTDWQWDFDNDGTVDSTEQNPTHTYASAGVYSVKLTVTAAGGGDDDTQIDYISVSAPVNRKIGNSQVFSNVTTSSKRRAEPYTMPEDGIIQSITMYHAAGSGQMLLGLYADDGQGAPGSRLGVTAETEVSSIEGWQTVDLIAPVFVTAGTPIWLAWVYENNPGVLYQTGMPGRAQSNETWSGGMPISYGSSSIASYIYSLYATYIPDTVDAPQHVYAFPIFDTHSSYFRSPLLQIGATQVNQETWRYTNDQGKEFIIHISQDDIATMIKALTTDSIVVMAGHAVYGSSHAPSNNIKIAEGRLYGILYVDDPGLLKMTSPFFDGNISAIRSYFDPAWEPIYRSGESAIMPFGFFDPSGESPPYNYEIVYKMGSDSTCYSTGIERMAPGSNADAWFSADCGEPDPTNPAHWQYFITQPVFFSEGIWVEESSADDYGSNYLEAGSGYEEAIWETKVPVVGNYILYGWWPSSAANTTNATYTVNQPDGSEVAVFENVDQSSAGGSWQNLGQFSIFNPGPVAVILTGAAVSGNVVADAVRIVYRDNPTVFDQIIDNTTSPSTHYSNRTILRRNGLPDIPANQLRYKKLYLHTCNSGRYYLQQYTHGVVFYSETDIGGVHAQKWLIGVLQEKSDYELWQILQNVSPDFDYYDYSKYPWEQP